MLEARHHNYVQNEMSENSVQEDTFKPTEAKYLDDFYGIYGDYGYESIESCGYMFSYHDEDSFTRSLSRLVSSQIPPAAIYKAFKEAFSLETGIEKLRTILKQENISNLWILR